MKSDSISLNNIIGSILAELRKNSGFTQKEFAKIFNISESTLAHYEQGLTPNVINLTLAKRGEIC